MKCNICDSERLRNYLNHKDINLLQCQQCKIIFIDKIPSDEIIRNYYQDEFYDKKKSERFKKLFEITLGMLRYIRVSAIQRFCKRPGKMVDVGFSRGVTMRILKSKGWQTFGTQVSLSSYEHAKKNGLNVFLGDVASAEISSHSIDLVTFWHVLEHLKYPDQYLKGTNRILKNNGRLIIEIPNIGSPIAKLFKEKWFALDLPRHIYHFSPYSLDFILRKNGFLVVKKTYFSLEQSIFSLLQSILNLFNSKNNLLFDSMKKKLNNLDFFLVVYNWLLAGIFLFPCILFSLLISFTSKGDIIRFYCVKTKEA